MDTRVDPNMLVVERPSAGSISWFENGLRRVVEVLASTITTFDLWARKLREMLARRKKPDQSQRT